MKFYTLRVILWALERIRLLLWPKVQWWQTPLVWVSPFFINAMYQEMERRHGKDWFEL